MLNFKYLFHPSSCGYYCLKKVIKKVDFKRKGYMSLYEIKEELMKNNYYCFCCRVKRLGDVKGECFTLINNKTNLHYVIIKRINCKFVYFYDPLFLINRRVKKDKFIKKWSRICLFYTKICFC